MSQTTDDIERFEASILAALGREASKPGIVRVPLTTLQKRLRLTSCKSIQRLRDALRRMHDAGQVRVRTKTGPGGTTTIAMMQSGWAASGVPAPLWAEELQ